MVVIVRKIITLKMEDWGDLSIKRGDKERGSNKAIYAINCWRLLRDKVNSIPVYSSTRLLLADIELSQARPTCFYIECASQNFKLMARVV